MRPPWVDDISDEPEMITLIRDGADINLFTSGNETETSLCLLIGSLSGSGLSSSSIKVVALARQSQYGFSPQVQYCFVPERLVPHF